jgi:cell division protein FtsQ
VGKKRTGARPQAQAEVLPFPAAVTKLRLARLAPSTRSILAGVVILLSGAGAYVAARETSLFALRTIEVRGASPRLEAQVRHALAPLLGKSLVALDSGAAAARVAKLPDVASVSVDRAFPNTLKLLIRAERPVAVLRRGTDAWLVSASTRVLRKLAARPYPRLPRIWVPRSVDVAVNADVSGDAVTAVQAVAPLQGMRFPVRVASVRVAGGVLTLALASGQQIRLGDASDLRLKLAVAARILPLASGAHYLDVSVPDRSVAGFNSQLSG